ncbi:MAG TPA: hypothetical protein VE621_07065 [Bryobacteraceae bacterium]|nr:hypothetical protein [Bryobacteraceae bacterium]
MQRRELTNPDRITIRGLSSIALRAVAALWAMYVFGGVVDICIRLLLTRAYRIRNDVVILPWLILPLAASGGIAAAYAIWAGRRPDQIGVFAQLAIALAGAVSILAIRIDLGNNRDRIVHLVGTDVFTIAVLLLVVISAIRHARARPWRPWRRILRMMIGLIPLVVSVVAAGLAISGWTEVSRTGFEGWGVFTTPFVAIFSAMLAAVALALTWLGLRILSDCSH